MRVDTSVKDRDLTLVFDTESISAVDEAEENYD